MHVTQGQILATLDDSDYQVALASAMADREATAASIADLEVQLGNATREVKRTKGLTDAGIQTAAGAGRFADAGGAVESANRTSQIASAGSGRENRHK